MQLLPGTLAQIFNEEYLQKVFLWISTVLMASCHLGISLNVIACGLSIHIASLVLISLCFIFFKLTIVWLFFLFVFCISLHVSLMWTKTFLSCLPLSTVFYMWTKTMAWDQICWICVLPLTPTAMAFHTSCLALRGLVFPCENTTMWASAHPVFVANKGNKTCKIFMINLAPSRF